MKQKDLPCVFLKKDADSWTYLRDFQEFQSSSLLPSVSDTRNSLIPLPQCEL